MNFLDDLKFSARVLVRTRQSTLAMISVLGVVLGISTGVFTIANAMTRGLPVEGAEELVSLSAYDDAGRTLGVSYLDFQEWRQLDGLIDAGAYSQTVLTLTESAHPTEQFQGAYVSAGTFELLGDRPILGRSFRADDDGPGAERVVVVSHSVWQERYAGRPDVVGRSIGVNGDPATIVGVMPEGFGFPLVAEIWQPLGAMPGIFDQARDARNLQVFGRLAPGATPQSVLAELRVVTARLSREYPATNAGVEARLGAYPGAFAPESLLLTLNVAMVFLLLTAVVNVANASAQRTLEQSRQLAIHAALGASRARIAGRVLAENVIVAAFAGVLGFVVALAGLRAFTSSVAGLVLPYYVEWTMDARVAVFLAGAALVTGLVCGLIPTVHVVRSHVSLTGKGLGSDPAVNGRRWAMPLLAVELAVTFVLLVSAGLMMRSFLAVYRADLVIDAASLLETRMTLPAARYATLEQRTIFHDRLEQRIAMIPGVESVAIATAAPYGGAGLRQLSIDGRPESSGRDAVQVSTVAVSPTYFRTLGLELVSGRPFSDGDGSSGSAVAIINQRLAALYFPNTNPLGRRIRLLNANAGPPGPWLTIVGVSRTLRQQFFQELDPVAYVPMRLNAPPVLTLLVRPGGDANVVPAIRQAIQAIDPMLASSRVTRLDDIMAQSRWGHRVLGNLFSVFALCALGLCAVGLYAVTAYSVTQRTREIGVRLAVGARPRDITRHFLRRAVIPLALGMVGGLVGGLWVGRMLRAFLIQTPPHDVLTFTTIATVLGVTTLLACFIPARRGARLDPALALRSE